MPRYDGVQSHGRPERDAHAFWWRVSIPLWAGLAKLAVPNYLASVVLKPGFQLVDRDQIDPPPLHDLEFRENVALEKVTADAARGGCLLHSERCAIGGRSSHSFTVAREMGCKQVLQYQLE